MAVEKSKAQAAEFKENLGVRLKYEITIWYDKFENDVKTNQPIPANHRLIQLLSSWQVYNGHIQLCMRSYFDVAEALLMYACEEGDVNAAQTALRLGATNVNDGMASVLYLRPSQAQEQSTLVDLLIAHRANNWRKFLRIVTSQNDADTFDWTFIKKFVPLADDLESACENAARHDNLELAKFLIETGRVSPDSVNTMFRAACDSGYWDWRRDGKFNQTFADYLVDECGATDFQGALNCAAMHGKSVLPFEYLRKRATTTLYWDDPMCRLFRYKASVSTQSSFVTYILKYGNLSNNFKFENDKCRFPQHRPLILALAEQGVPMSILGNKINGFHKFAKNLKHRHVLVAKYLKKRIATSLVLTIILPFVVN